jgi:hypothetical protein
MRTVAKSRRNLLRWGIAGTIVVVVIAAALTITLLSGLVRAADGGSPASNWHLGYYTPSGRALSFAAAPSAATGIASLDFTNQANTALLVTDQRAKFGSLLGNDVGKTVTATFTISGAVGAFTYYGDPDGSGQPAKVRLFFETSNAGGFDYTHYWWSNPSSVVLANGTFTVTATVDPALWSDWNGQFGNTVPNGFAQAASNVTEIGLSFGGGFFFENGVGTTDGSGTFALTSYTVS